MTPAAEEMLDRVVYAAENSSIFRCGFKVVMVAGSGTFCNWRQRVPDSWCHDAECFGLEV